MRTCMFVVLAVISAVTCLGQGVYEIMFVKSVGGIKQLYVIDTKGLQERAITHFTADAPTLAGPSYSPDGSKVAFWLDQGTGINVWLMDADGSNMRQVTSNNEAYVGTHIEFSATMDKLYYRRTVVAGAASIWQVGVDGQNNSLFYDFPGNEYAIEFIGSSHLLYHVNGGGIYRTNSISDLTSSLLIAGGEMPALNHAQTRFAYRKSSSEIAVANIDGSSQVVVANEPGGVVLDPSLTADDENVVYCVNNEIKIAKTDGTLQLHLSNGWDPTIRPVSDLLFVKSVEGVKQICAINTDGTAPKVVTHFTADPPTLASPSYSPDGSKVAFWLDQGTGINVWLMDADGSNMRQVTSNNEAYVGTHIEFSATMDKLYYRRTVVAGAASIWQVGVDGQNNSLFYDFPGNEYAIEFIGSSHLLYHVNGGGIYRTNSISDLTSSLLIAGGEMPALNHAQTRFAYRKSSSEIAVANIDGSSQVVVANEPGGVVLDPSLTADDENVVYCVNNQINVIRVNGTSKTFLTNGWDPTINPCIRPQRVIRGIKDFGRPVPEGAYSLAQNYPNPFNPSTNIQFTIANRQLTIVKVFDVLGKEVATLVNEVKEPGTYTVEFNGSNLPSGVYFYRLEAGGFVQTKKLLLLK